MKAIILAGGEGRRLQPLTCRTPKAMVPVLNKPFLEHVIEHLKKHSIDTIILTLCYLPQNLKAYFGDGRKFDVNIIYIDEKEPLGTAGAVKNAEIYLDSDFFVLNGDIFTDLDYTEMLQMHREKRSMVSIALTPVEDPSAYGVVEMVRENRIERFVEKPKAGEFSSSMINAGTYIINPKTLHNIPVSTPFSFERQFFPLLLSKGEPLYGFPTGAYWIDIGTPDKYLKLNYELLNKGLHMTAGASGSERQVRIGEGTYIAGTTCVEGSTMIGDNSSVNEKVVIKGPSVIGNNCQIGSGTQLEGVVLWDKVTIGKNAKLRNCIVGNNCMVNDNSCISPGCVIADSTTVLPGCVIDPGTKIWPGSIVP